MKNIILFVVSISMQLVTGQTVIEVNKPLNIENSYEIFEEPDTNLSENILKLEKALTGNNNAFQKDQIYQYLSYYYTETNQKEKCLKLWDSLNKAGIIFPFETSAYVDPPFLSKYLDNQRFEKFIERNTKMREEASKKSSLEYFVNLPVNYDSTKSYPLIIVMHGGIGNFYDMYLSWNSKIISEEFIAVYPQGRQIYASFTRRFGETGILDIQEVYKQVKNKYAVNSEQVVLAGQSLGGHLSLQLTYESITAKGLFLAFPVKPAEFNLSSAQSLEKKNTKVVMICGENDSYFSEGQKELALMLDSAEVLNNTMFYPNLGHEFPKDFSKQLNLGLEFIINKE